ncbi:hypothetical protein EW146_g6448 [Bondarzewia mesenterica]|uniref:Protein PBN1 n=1 Tax=Bondarzewia mesenterica TaxID=1095465 RepID=A0A4S4LQK8_9AGAM|nr:hypothetical protein EW146_g6448 [Bondarzewia mesenterica]
MQSGRERVGPEAHAFSYIIDPVVHRRKSEPVLGRFTHASQYLYPATSATLMSVSSTLSSVQGFHTTLSSRITSERPPSCSLHLYQELPNYLFVDPYELDHYSDSYSFELSGPSNLEAPVFTVNDDSTLLLNLSLPVASSQSLNLTVDIPLHLRYGRPAKRGESAGHHLVAVTVPAPVAFWACTDPRVFFKEWFPAPHALTYDLAHPPTADLPQHLTPSLRFHFTDTATEFIRIPSAQDSASLSQAIHIPVGDLSDLENVETSTTIVVYFAFAWLFYVAWQTARRLNSGKVGLNLKQD